MPVSETAPIKSLELQVEANATKANAALDKLAEKLEAIAGILGGMSSLTRSIGQVGDISKIFGKTNAETEKTSKNIDAINKKKIKPKTDESELLKMEQRFEAIKAKMKLSDFVGGSGDISKAYASIKQLPAIPNSYLDFMKMPLTLYEKQLPALNTVRAYSKLIGDEWKSNSSKVKQFQDHLAGVVQSALVESNKNLPVVTSSVGDYIKWLPALEQATDYSRIIDVEWREVAAQSVAFKNAIDEAYEKYAGIGSDVDLGKNEHDLSLQIDQFSDALDDAMERASSFGDTSSAEFQEAAQDVVWYTNALQAAKDAFASLDRSIKSEEFGDVNAQVDAIVSKIGKAGQAVQRVKPMLDEMNADLWEAFQNNKGLGENVDVASNEKDLEIQIAQLSDELAQATAKFNSFGDTGSKEAKKTAEDIVFLTNVLRNAKAALDEMRTAMNPETGEDFLDSRTSNPSRTNAAYAAERDALAAEIWGSTSGDIENASEEAENLSSNLSDADNYAKELAKRAKQISDRFKAVGAAIKALVALPKAMYKDFGRVVDSIKKVGTAIKEPIKSMRQLLGLTGGKGVFSQLFGGSKNFGQYVGLMALRKVINSVLSTLSSATREGSDNLAQYSSIYNNSISSMASALLYLKNAWAAAFAPIVNVVAPYITAFINMIATAANAVGRFLAALTGKGFAVQAKSVFGSVAADLAGAGSAAGGANKELEEYKNTIMSFDELHVLNDQNESGSGGGGGVGGGGLGDINPQDMFTTVETNDAVSNFAKSLREAILREDWDSVGKLLADKINKAFARIDKAISWDNVGGKITKFTTGVTKSFNSLVKNIDWALIGKTLGDGVNTVVRTLNQLADGVDWKTLGSKLGTALTNFVKTVKWDEVGRLLGQKVRIIWDTLYGFVTSTDWDAVADAFVTTVTNIFDQINIIQIAETINTFLTKFLGGLAKHISEHSEEIEQFGHDLGVALGKIDWKTHISNLVSILATVIGSLFSGLDDTNAGKMVIGIVTALAGAVTVARFMPFINAVCKIFTGSTVTEKLGQALASAFGHSSPTTPGTTGVTNTPRSTANLPSGGGSVLSEVGGVAFGVGTLVALRNANETQKQNVSANLGVNDISGERINAAAISGANAQDRLNNLLGAYNQQSAELKILEDAKRSAEAEYKRIDAALNTTWGSTSLTTDDLNKYNAYKETIQGIDTKIINVKGNMSDLNQEYVNQGVELNKLSTATYPQATRAVEDTANKAASAGSFLGSTATAVSTAFGSAEASATKSFSTMGNNVLSQASAMNTGTTKQVGQMSSNLTTGIASGCTSAIKNAESFKTNLGATFGNAAKDSKTSGTKIGSNLGTGISSQAKLVTDSATRIKNGAVSALEDNGESTKKGESTTTNYGTGISNQKSTVDNIAKTVKESAIGQLETSGTMEKAYGRSVSTYFANGVGEMGTTAATVASGVLSSVLDALNNTSGWWTAYSAGQQIIYGFNSGLQSIKPKTFSYSVTYRTIGTTVVPASLIPHVYAKGGFPNLGELFIARENGPELVGSMGSHKNTVANNAQIVEGIEAGVTRAMRQALASSGGDSAPYVINLNVRTENDEVLFRAVERGKAKRSFRYSPGTVV